MTLLSLLDSLVRWLVVSPVVPSVGMKWGKQAILHRGCSQIWTFRDALYAKHSPILVLNHFFDDRRENYFHRNTHHSAGYNQCVGARHKRIRDHCQQVLDVHTFWIAEDRKS